jgi:hypothetical protein
MGRDKPILNSRTFPVKQNLEGVPCLQRGGRQTPSGQGVQDQGQRGKHSPLARAVKPAHETTNNENQSYIPGLENRSNNHAAIRPAPPCDHRAATCLCACSKNSQEVSLGSNHQPRCKSPARASAGLILPFREEGKCQTTRTRNIFRKTLRMLSTTFSSQEPRHRFQVYTDVYRVDSKQFQPRVIPFHLSRPAQSIVLFGNAPTVRLGGGS